MLPDRDYSSLPRDSDVERESFVPDAPPDGMRYTAALHRSGTALLQGHRMRIVCAHRQFWSGAWWAQYTLFCLGTAVTILSQVAEPGTLPGWLDHSRGSMHSFGMTLLLLAAVLAVPVTLRLLHLHYAEQLPSHTPSCIVGVVWNCVVVATLIMVPYITWQLLHLQHKARIPRALGTFLCTLFAAFAIVFSCNQIILHWQNYSDPQFQRHLVRILFMVPLYAFTATASFYTVAGGRTTSIQMYFNTITGIYEAYVLNNFVMYLLRHLNRRAERLHSDSESESVSEDGDQRLGDWSEGGSAQLEHDSLDPLALPSDADEAPVEPRAGDKVVPQRGVRTPALERDTRYVLSKRGANFTEAAIWMMHSEAERFPPSIACPFPFKRVTPWRPGAQFLYHCQVGVQQYVLLQVVITLSIYVCDVNHVYHEGVFDSRYAYLYLTVVKVLSQSYALWCLIYLYHGTARVLKDIYPLRKFLAIKMVVVFIWWQELALTLLEMLTLLPFKEYWESWTVHENGVDGKRLISLIMQNVLLCVEMFVLSLAHRNIFSHEEYSRSAPVMPACSAALHSMNPCDVMHDMALFLADLCTWLYQLIKRICCSRGAANYT